MRKYIVFLVCLITDICSYSQTRLNSQMEMDILEKISKRSSAISTMQCQFIQSKSMKMLNRKLESKGELYYKKENKIRWQYTSPYEYVFVMNGDKLNIKSSRGTQVQNIKDNKVFQQISSNIVDCLIGGNLRQSNTFKIEFYKVKDSYYANLYPLKKEMKQIYKKIVIYFDKDLSSVERIQMMENNEDITEIQLRDIIINKQIEDKVFSIN